MLHRIIAILMSGRKAIAKAQAQKFLFPDSSARTGSNPIVNASSRSSEQPTPSNATRRSDRQQELRRRTDEAVAVMANAIALDGIDEIVASPPPQVARSTGAQTPAQLSSKKTQPPALTSPSTLDILKQLRESPRMQSILSAIRPASSTLPEKILRLTSHDAPDSPARSPGHSPTSNLQKRQQPNPSKNSTSDAPEAHVPDSLSSSSSATTPADTLFSSATAQLQHSVATAVAATMPPVGQLQLIDTSHGQSAHWLKLQQDLSRKQSLSPAEELQRLLLRDLQALHQQQVEQARQMEQRQIAQAAEILALRKELGASKSNPVIVQSHSPTHVGPAQAASAGHPHSSVATTAEHALQHQQVSAHVQSSAPHTSLGDSASRPVTVHSQPPAASVRFASPTLQQLRVPAAKASTLHRQSLPPVPPKETWLSEAQRLSTKQAQVKYEAQQQEQIEYAEHQRLLAEEAQDQAIIRAAMQRSQKRLHSLQSSTPPSQPHSAPSTAKMSSTRATATRQSELQMAALTNDRELLRARSDACRRNEAVSEDEDAEILAEAPAALAAAHLFSTTKTKDSLKSLRDRNGYIPNAFVADDNQEEDAPASQSVETAGSYESHETDGDPSSDYVPSKSSSLARSSPAQSLSAIERQEYEALKRAESLRQRQNSTPDTRTPRYNISIADPPEHGDWSDINHLITVFKDKHAKYVKRCGEGRSLSVWDCYTETAQTSIVKQLRTKPSAFERDSEYLASLPDAELYALLQNELGISYDMEVEQALQAIPFVGSILDTPSWVAFNTAWAQVLKRVTTSGQVQPRRMAEIFRERIPDDFMRSWLKSRKHPTWEDAYEAAIGALRDPDWKTCYLKHIIAKAAPPAQTKPSASKPASQSKPPEPAASAPTNTDGQTKLNFPSTPGKNANPNFKHDLMENKSKSKCDRCGYIHKWNSDLCTNIQHAEKKKLTPLPTDELIRRLQTRWDMGYSFNKDISVLIAGINKSSPTPGDAAAAATKASKKIASHTDGKDA